MWGAPAMAADACTPESFWDGTCAVTGELTDLDKVTLIGLEKFGSQSDIDAFVERRLNPFADCVNPNSTTCLRPFIAIVTSPVSLSDIATFLPTPPADHSEPNGWTIAGLDTNFYATGSQHVVDGVLLGQPASVRFTPVAWNWTYGDGTTATRAVPGAPWSTRAAEFNPTPTSHVYRERATFTIALTVNYAAEYRYAGGPWVPISGTLRVPANELTLAVGSAKTVLVNENCNQNPRGPGC